MAYQHKENSGSLFKNDKREKDSQPQAKGSALIDGVEYWVSAWTNTKDDGTRWQALRFERKEQQQAQQQPADDPAPFDDDLPF